MWECGVASDSHSPETTLVVFQCGPDVPAPFQDVLRVNPRSYQGEFVLARKFKIVREVTLYLDISLVIVYNRFQSRKGGMIGFEPRRSASASG